MDRIRISDLAVRCIIGVNDEERREKQDVSINIVIHADLAKAGRTDRFEDTVDYRDIKKRVVSMVEASHFYLVEALAQAVADICLEQPAVKKVDVRVDKTGALRFARSVGVEITRERVAKVKAFVSIGSNVRPRENVKNALRLLATHVRIAGISTVYETPALLRPNEAAFYNSVVEIETDMEPKDLKARVLERIEGFLGRERTADKFASRTIDLDLIVYDDLAVSTDEFTLPDPEITKRPWLALGLAELAGDLELTGMGLRAGDIAAKASRENIEPLEAYTEDLRKEILGAVQR